MSRVERRRQPRLRPLAAIAVAFFAGVFIDGWLRTYGPPIPESVRAIPVTANTTPTANSVDKRIEEPKIAATAGSIPHGRLRVPIDGADVQAWKGSFGERRDGGQRGHEAVDILSPRNTPVHAVAAGTVAKIFESKAGGHTVYQFDSDGRLCYYYAHLERYADGLHDGQHVDQGDVIGYVGTSGNAPANTPHLHFAVFQLDGEKRWWKGTPLDPYEVFTR